MFPSISFEAKEVIVTQIFLLLGTLLSVLFQIYRENKERKWRRESREEEMLHWNRIEEDLRERKRSRDSRTRVSDMRRHETIDDKRTK